MTITRNFKLCLNAGTQNAPYINVNQYDEGEEWVFDLYTEGGQKFTPSTGAIIGIKSDGNAILNSGTVNSDGQVVITETQQMTAASGLAVFELLIEGETHGTANFIVNVERRPSDDAEFSDSDLSMLQEAIDAAEVINEILDAGGDPSEIITENVNNWLDNHPEATTTVEDGAITAPKINNSLWDKILVNEEVSGNPASFDDGADDVPVSSLKVALEPIQTGSGDPSPSNIRPISGHSSVTVDRCGKNLITDNAEDLESGSIDGATGNPASGANRVRYANMKPFPLDKLVDEGYHLIVPTGYDFAVRYYDANGNFIYKGTAYTGFGNSLFTTVFYGQGVKYVKLVYRKSDNSNIQPSDINHAGFSCTFGGVTSYEPYQSASYPYTLGQNVYGGTVDLATGVLTVTHVMWTDSGTGWAMNNDGSFYKFYSPSPASVQTADGCACNYAPYAISYSGMAVFARSNGLISLGNGWGSVYADVASLQAAFASTPIQVVYKLATPQTIQLTPTEVKTLLGYNNISSSGTVDVIYHADTKLYIDKKIGELS